MKLFLIVAVAMVGLVAQTHADKKMTRGQITIAADMLDKDKDGYISKDELNVMNVMSDEALDIAYQGILLIGDTNDDSKVSKEEYIDVTYKAGGGASSSQAATAVVMLLAAALTIF